ncbi:MAG: sulfite exporter TauE/SafE family protein [Cyanobacteriota bacterium]|jgi:uncharacterized membrane protein YfcA
MSADSLALLAGGGALIGVLLSLLGAGGSILLLPLLVSGAALPTREAVPLSLVVVSVLALANLGPVVRRGQVAPKPALILGLPALAGSWVGGSWGRGGLVPESLQLALFAGAALVASWLLTQGQTATSSPRRRARPAAYCDQHRVLALAVQGLCVGLLTGIAGVGGGFAIVPALVLLAGLPMARASGTSLLLIAVNALVALAALGHWPTTKPSLVLAVLGGGAIGVIGGQWLAPYLSDRRLRQGFSLLLLGSALLTGSEAWRRHHPSLHHAQASQPPSQLHGNHGHPPLNL